ncbi:MAG: sensor domain-containing diguanylate cyclase [Candidatus Omnitrophota bacterium]|nr:sensor domain-containing diguanylate cyclase [Candidatus Omnitrophota bacterium]
MKNEIIRLKEELEKARWHLYIFYELTKAMHTTLHLEEISYIILTGLTAHQGLAFNRAILFLSDTTTNTIKGFMGVGPMDNHEATEIWQNIEEEKKGLYDLIKTYHRIKEGKIKVKFMDFIQSLSFSQSKESGFISSALCEKEPLHIKKDDPRIPETDPLKRLLQLEEFLIAPLWIEGRNSGLIIVDNYVTKKPIIEEDIKIFNMFVDQSSGAIKNSQSFEDTLIKAQTDPLTGLWNYRYFQRQLDAAIKTAKTQNQNISVMMIDIDNFKKFNDTCGHIHGNLALQEISKILKDTCRKIDTLCRYGGEEFSLILPHSSKENAHLLGERIRQCVETTPILDNHAFTISIGISSFPQDGDNKETLLRKADEALYAAKRNGKNQVVLADFIPQPI